MIVGQEQDGLPFFDPVFDKKQGFSGLLTQIELWNTQLTSYEIRDIATCKMASLRPQNKVITWKSNAWQATRETNFRDISIEKLCKKNLVLNQFIWPSRIDFYSFNNFCRTIDGKYLFPSIKATILKNTLYISSAQLAPLSAPLGAQDGLVCILVRHGSLDTWIYLGRFYPPRFYLCR